MRCLSCNCILNDFESTRKYADGTYVDLCKRCFNSSDQEGIEVIERSDLQEEEMMEEIETEEEDHGY